MNKLQLMQHKQKLNFQKMNLNEHFGAVNNLQTNYLNYQSMNNNYNKNYNISQKPSVNNNIK